MVSKLARKDSRKPEPDRPAAILETPEAIEAIGENLWETAYGPIRRPFTLFGFPRASSQQDIIGIPRALSRQTPPPSWQRPPLSRQTPIARNLFGTEPDSERRIFGIPRALSRQTPPPSWERPPLSRLTPIARNLFGTEPDSERRTPILEAYVISESPSSSETNSNETRVVLGSPSTLADRILNSYKPNVCEEFRLTYNPEYMNCIRRNFDDFNLGTTSFPTLKEVFPETYTDYLEVTHIPSHRLIRQIQDKLGAICLSYNNKKFEECKFVLPSRHPKYHVYIPEIDRIVLRLCKQERMFEVSSQQSSFLGRTFEVLRIVVNLLITDSFLTKRGLFYQAPLLFGKQRVSDNLIEDVSCMLECSRESLHITAAKTGQVIGDLRFDEADDNEVRCDRGIQIPDDVEQIENTRTQNAKFILLVEKDSVFNILKKEKFCNNVDCIVITGEGQPSVNTRLFLRIIQRELKLPIFGVFDCNIRGFEMLSIYRWGSRNRSYESERLAIHDIQWLGLRPSQLKSYKIPTKCIQPLKEKDSTKAFKMYSELPWARDTEWRRELLIVMNDEETAELESLNFDNPRGVVKFLIERLKEMDFIGKRFGKDN
ncbi:hypothetical protein ACFX2I_044261 [Malus domestica]|uniref:meiotic recombination protein SPO11-2-like n=1 Tax=Malus domestica TaxID=3750 RepID=UPI00397588DC